jgi:hypothetical protein
MDDRGGDRGAYLKACLGPRGSAGETLVTAAKKDVIAPDIVALYDTLIRT